MNDENAKEIIKELFNIDKTLKDMTEQIYLLRDIEEI